MDRVTKALSSALTRLRIWDASAARDALDRFERSHHLDHHAADVRSGDADAVHEALKPRGRYVIEHHWATWCEPCLDELPQIQALEGVVRGRADVVGVSWERFMDDHGAAESVEKVATFMASRGLKFTTLVVSDGPDAFMVALDLPVTTVPQTRVWNPDGQVIAAYEGPLDAEAASEIARLVGAQS